MRSSAASAPAARMAAAATANSKLRFMLPSPARRAGARLTLHRPILVCAHFSELAEGYRHGKGRDRQDQARQLGRHRLLLRDQEELPHQDREDGAEEVRSGRPQARRVPRDQDQIARSREAGETGKASRPPPSAPEARTTKKHRSP